MELVTLVTLISDNDLYCFLHTRHLKNFTKNTLTSQLKAFTHSQTHITNQTIQQKTTFLTYDEEFQMK